VTSRRVSLSIGSKRRRLDSDEPYQC
jgi:hypothetical protein